MANSAYCGFEQGPIRPPNEARSLLIRVTRNCPWNRCSFCPVYKTAKFSVRDAEHVKQDIDLVHKYAQTVLGLAGDSGRMSAEDIRRAAEGVQPAEMSAFAASVNWVLYGGMKSVFLQDADSLVMKPDQLVEILVHLRKRFPSVGRITSYARSFRTKSWRV